MKATKENLVHHKWYMVCGDSRCILQYNKYNIDSSIGYWNDKWGTYWSFPKNSVFATELATKEDLAKLGNEWEPYWEEGIIGDGLVSSNVQQENKIEETFQELQERGHSCFRDCLEDHKELFQEVVGKLIDGTTIKEEPKPIVLKNGEFTTTDKELAEAMDELLHKPKEKYLKRFASGAVRSDSRGKLRVDFISPYALKLLAKHFTKNSDDFNGEEEFGVNYFKGIRPEDINPSLTRHWLDVQIALTEGNKEQVKEELTALGANVIMALHQIVLEEKGLYKEEFEGISYIEK